MDIVPGSGIAGAGVEGTEFSAPRPQATFKAGAGRTANPVHPGKLLMTKWTATRPLARQKHFLVSRVVMPEAPGAPVLWVEIEAVHSKAVRRIPWRELRDASLWRQGWV